MDDEERRPVFKQSHRNISQKIGFLIFPKQEIFRIKTRPNDPVKGPRPCRVENNPQDIKRPPRPTHPRLGAIIKKFQERQRRQANPVDAAGEHNVFLRDHKDKVRKLLHASRPAHAQANEHFQDQF